MYPHTWYLNLRELFLYKFTPCSVLDQISCVAKSLYLFNKIWFIAQNSFFWEVPGWKIKILLARIRLGGEGANEKLWKQLVWKHCIGKHSYMSGLILLFYSETSGFWHFKKTYFDVFQIEKYSFETWHGIFMFPAMKMSFMSPSSYFLVQTQLAGMVWSDFALPGC